MFFRAAALRQVGGMDPVYWLYFEDVDLSWRVRQAGWKIAVVPSARAWHGVTPSNDKSMAIRARYSSRNRLVFMARHTRGPHRLSALKYMARVVRRHGPGVVVGPGRGLIRGVWDFLLGRTGPIRGSW